ncbi:Gephyrin, putative [Acanthamoeba castellanii str. Neff]|uniref:molybdopterin molybdotransferase n=1 Tax=Acanthamoeba castellanii (strain ATCC 30010 / Neff) TaxID=1257118 RepID=L8HJW0_ACACF|nr:Gephyrin, putative [Acanthamoeba castellanii str. Neff]ELR24968.1 Gephyrin, putative [Acanthamoeba castellanii str. Neff]
MAEQSGHTTVEVGVLTVSDRVSRGEAEDLSGPLAISIIEQHLKHAKVVATAVVADEVDDIQRVLKEWSDGRKLQLILTTGGTGFAPRDITPEATKAILDREAPGMVVAMVSASLQVTPHAMLSRPAAGMRKQTLIVNLPGSSKAVKENIDVLLPVLPHAIGLLRQDPRAAQPSQHHKLDMK